MIKLLTRGIFVRVGGVLILEGYLVNILGKKTLDLCIFRNFDSSFSSVVGEEGIQCARLLSLIPNFCVKRIFVHFQINKGV